MVYMMIIVLYNCKMVLSKVVRSEFCAISTQRTKSSKSFLKKIKIEIIQKSPELLHLINKIN